MVEHTMRDVRDFLRLRRIAAIGLSRNERHFSRALFQEMLRRGYDAVPVNPAADQIAGLHCYHSVESISPPVEGALILTPAKQALQVVEECDKAGIRFLWMYRAIGAGSVTPEAVAFARSRRMRLVAGECPYMFWKDPGWFHSLHRTIRHVTGGLPAA